MERKAASTREDLIEVCRSFIEATELLVMELARDKKVSPEFAREWSLRVKDNLEWLGNTLNMPVPIHASEGKDIAARWH